VPTRGSWEESQRTNSGGLDLSSLSREDPPLLGSGSSSKPVCGRLWGRSGKILWILSCGPGESYLPVDLPVNRVTTWSDRAQVRARQSRVVNHGLQPRPQSWKPEEGPRFPSLLFLGGELCLPRTDWILSGSLEISRRARNPSKETHHQGDNLVIQSGTRKVLVCSSLPAG